MCTAHSVHKPLISTLNTILALPLEDTEARVLLVLLSEKELPIMDIPKKAGLSNQAARRAVEKLLDRGLVAEEREQVFPRRRMIRLTGRGEKAARLLLELEEILEKEG